ncbi:hypothetical protein ACFE04_015714 [Oxalis oulophora]
MAVSFTPVDNITKLSNDLLYDILNRLDGQTIATATCVCSTFSSVSNEEKLWENVCSSMWPSTNNEDVKILISSIGGFKKFYADCFPFIVNKQVSEYQYHKCPDEWTKPENYSDVDEISPSDFISIVDIRFKDKTVFSKVLWEIPDVNGFKYNGWFDSCPFRIDLLPSSLKHDSSEEEIIILSAANGLQEILPIEKERREGKLWKDLHDNLQLSWIVVNRKIKQAANLTTWSPLGGRRHWPTDKDFVIRFGSVLPAKNIIFPSQVAECNLLVKFQVVCTGVQTSLKMTELSMQLKDMDGVHVNGRNSLFVLKEALSSRRSKNYSEVLESCRLYSKVQTKLKEAKMRNENRVERLCMVSGIAAFITFSFWFYIL